MDGNMRPVSAVYGDKTGTADKAEEGDIKQTARVQHLQHAISYLVR